MASINVEINPKFHQELWDHYAETTSYTSEVGFFGDITITPTTNYTPSGSELSTYYTIDGFLNFTTEKTIKYIYFSVLVYNRVQDVIGEVKYSYMGPFNGSGSFDLKKRFGEGLSKGTFEYMGVKSVTIDYMDGTSGTADLDIFCPVEVLKLETERDRNAFEEPEIGKIILINLFLTPFIGLIYSLYKLIQGYKLASKVYFIVTGIFMILYIIVMFLLPR